jgi:exopolysaccharide biosynthesis protein
MKNIFQKRYGWSVIYSVIITMSVTYVLLDTFVIPRPIKAVPQPIKTMARPIPAESKSVPDAPETAHIRPVIAVKKTEAAAVHHKNDSPDVKQTAAAEIKSAAPASAPGNASTAEPVIESVSRTDTSYRDANISIEISTKRFADTRIYIADITLKSLAHLKTAFAQDVFGRNITQTTSFLARSRNAILAINGDFCGFRNAGFVIRNGVLYRSTPRRTGDDGALVIYQDGSFKLIGERASKAGELIEKGAIQVFSFGPLLLEDGEIVVSQRTEVGRAKISNPRTAIGIISPLHYLFIVSDGRTGASMGLSLFQLASLFKEQGCQAAYNLDGGGSSTIWFNGHVINNPTDGMRAGERKVSDIVYVGYE